MTKIEVLVGTSVSAPLRPQKISLGQSRYQTRSFVVTTTAPKVIFFYKILFTRLMYFYVFLK